MSLPDFKGSLSLSLGVELELQLINKQSFDLRPCAEEVLEQLERRHHRGEYKPEMTRSMIELSTGVHQYFPDLLAELQEMRAHLREVADSLDILVSGGGTHPFQQWTEREIFDAPRFLYLSELYGYLAKQFTVFGQHVHIGCPDPDHGLRLLHGLSRFVPQFIALSASSSFIQGVDTGFDSARINSVRAFPLSGYAPFVNTWDEFREYFTKMTATGVVKSMKDFYWDIRPKPEFGTVEVRVCDTPITVERAAAIASYIQLVARHLTVEKSYQAEPDDYLVYTYNCFHAARYGLDAIIVEPKTHEQHLLRSDISKTLEKVAYHASALKAEDACNIIKDIVTRGNDATWIREQYKSRGNLPDVVEAQSKRWLDIES